jgi:hypothetical protein
VEAHGRPTPCEATSECPDCGPAVGVIAHTEIETWGDVDDNMSARQDE